MSRTVLVTGASNGIGQAIAARFATSGDTVIITGRHPGRSGTRPSSSAPAASSATPPTRPRWRRSAVTWDPSSMSWSTTRAATPTWTRPAGEPGRRGQRPPGQRLQASDLQALAASWRANLDANLLSAVAELGPRGITANVISAGYIAGTNFFRAALTSERRESLIAATHDKRPGRPDDIAATAYFLASPGARHIGGQTIHVNGGAFTTR